MTKQATVELLKQQLPGFYSAEQVIELINGIDESKSTTVISNEDEIKSIAASMAEEISDQADSLIGGYELEMNYREVEMTSITLDKYMLEEHILDFLKCHDIVMFKKQDEE